MRLMQPKRPNDTWPEHLAIEAWSRWFGLLDRLPARAMKFIPKRLK